MTPESEINEAELAICRVRGHAGHADRYWRRCGHCGMWTREVRKLEESRTTPPESEQDPMIAILRETQGIGELSRKRADELRKSGKP